MRINDLQEYLQTNSYQFLLGNDIEIDEATLLKIVKRAFAIYGGYKPLRVEAQINISSTRYKLSKYDNRIVDSVTSISLVDPVLFPDVDIPYEWNWNKSTKEIEIQSPGTYWVTMFLIPILDDITNDDEEFLELMLGLYLITIGTSRSLFQMTDLPFESNAENLVSIGEDIISEVKTRINNENNYWYLALE